MARINRAENRALSLQFAIERVENLKLQIGRGRIGYPDIKMKLDWVLSDLEASRTGDDDHGSSGGLTCGCHETTVAFENRPQPGCARCHGTGTVPFAEIRERAQEP